LAVASVSGVPACVAPGTPVDATVTVGVARGVVVPRSAVIEDPQTGAELVFVQSAAGGFQARRVTIDSRDDRFARVTSGVRIGERVASSGAIDLLTNPGGQP
jgi:multidrug efflux pump subunit AcrA (membrane-fusion protein)